MKKLTLFGLVTLLATILQPSTAATPNNNGITRVSVASDGTEANGHSYTLDVSGNGFYVAFQSEASNLVSGDTNGFDDIFLHHRTSGITTRISDPVGTTVDANGPSRNPSISESGNYIAFESDASNLVVGDTNGLTDVFVANRTTGTIIRVSVASDGSQADSFSYKPAISATGRYVAFVSAASNLDVDDNGLWFDVFIHDRNPDNDAVWDEPGQILTRRVSINSDGVAGNGMSGGPTAGRLAISADGDHIAFASSATNLVAGDLNGEMDVFLHDRDPDNNFIPDEPGSIETTRISVTDIFSDEANGFSADPRLSFDGRYVTFYSEATNLVNDDTNDRGDVFVRDRPFDQTDRVSVASDGSQNAGGGNSADMSSNGRYIAFHANNSNLVSDPCIGVFLDCVYRHDTTTGDTILISREPDGDPSGGHAYTPAISDSGGIIAFLSDNSFLTPGDTNGVVDVYAFDENALPQPASAYINIPTRQLSNGQHVLPWGRSDDITLPVRLSADHLDTITLDISITDDNNDTTTQTLTFPPNVLTRTITIPHPNNTENFGFLVTVEENTPPADETDNVAVGVVPPLQSCPVCHLLAGLGAIGLEDLLGCPLGEMLFGDEHWIDTLFAVRDNVMADTEMGRFYTGMYYGHSDELTQILLYNPAIMWSLWDGLREWSPALQALVDGDGDTVTISQQLVDTLDGVLVQIEGKASPQLQGVISAERNALNLQSFVGLNMDEAWAQINQRQLTQTYLPVLDE